MLNNFTKNSIITDIGKIIYYKRGDGPPVLLLHGYPQFSLMWEESALLLSQKYTTIIPDLRGYGKTTGGNVNYDELEESVLSGNVFSIPGGTNMLNSPYMNLPVEASLTLKCWQQIACACANTGSGNNFCAESLAIKVKAIIKTFPGKNHN